MRKRTAVQTLVAISLPFLLIGCGGGSSGGGGGGAGFTNNISGVWTGMRTNTSSGNQSKGTLTLLQPTSGAVTQGFSGALNSSTGTSNPGQDLPVTGTKNGNVINFTLVIPGNATFRGTYTGVLTSKNDMSGTYTESDGDKGVWSFSRD